MSNYGRRGLGCGRPAELYHQAHEEAVASWRALLTGRWSLVDHFDEDGKRYVVAVRNDAAQVPCSAALSSAEGRTLTSLASGCSAKVAADELGVAVSTIAARLASARRKLGFRTRVETIRFWRGLSRAQEAA